MDIESIIHSVNKEIEFTMNLHIESKKVGQSDYDIGQRIKSLWSKMDALREKALELHIETKNVEVPNVD